MKLNKRGQSAVIFIILIPVFLIVAALVVDTGINMYNEKKLENVTEDVITNLLENVDVSNVDYNNEAEITEKLEAKAELIYQNNDIETEYLRVEILYNNAIKISNSNTYYSFMNSLLNKGNGNRQTTIEAEGRKDEKGAIEVKIIGDAYEG